MDILFWQILTFIGAIGWGLYLAERSNRQMIEQWKEFWFNESCSKDVFINKLLEKMYGDDDEGEEWKR